MSLRMRVIAAVTFTAIVLTVVLVFVTRTTEANLVAQVDEQLEDAVRPVRGFDFGDRLGRGGGPGGGAPERPRRNLLSSLYVATVDDGVVITLAAPGLRGDDLPLPEIDAVDAVAASAAGEAITVRSAGSDLRWRLHVYDGSAGTERIIGLPLDTVDDAMSDLVTLEIIAAGIIFVSLALMAFWVIHLGIRPVNKMTKVATVIAGGDLTHRVPDTDPSTEAGRLGDALNRMLGSIEASFAERQRSEDRLRQFVADASHELRTPVATIRGYAELYRVGALADAAQLDDAMRRTEQESIRMGGLVEDLLALARLDQGRSLDVVPVDLSLIAADAAADALAVDPDRSIVVSAPRAAVVRADEANVRQVVANLVSNALVHTPAGTAVVIAAGPAGPDRCYIEVRDDGPGMAPEVAARAFERFYRADPSRSRHQGGSGLGLAIVDAIVRAHGGDVTLRTAPGAGTTVRIDLPSPPVVTLATAG